MPVKDIVSQYERDGIRSDEIAPDDERIGKPTRFRLSGIGDLQAKLRTVPEQTLKSGPVVRRCDDQNLADIREHQSRQRIIDHRLIVDGKKLLADDRRNWMEPGACSPS